MNVKTQEKGDALDIVLPHVSVKSEPKRRTYDPSSIGELHEVFDKGIGEPQRLSWKDRAIMTAMVIITIWSIASIIKAVF